MPAIPSTTCFAIAPVAGRVVCGSQQPASTLPLQYLAGFAMCAVFAPLQPLHVEWTGGFIGALLWMGLVVSLLATLLLYRLIAKGNLVNVTTCSTWCRR